MLTVNWFLQECTKLQSCTIGIRIHVYDQSRLNSFHSGHDPLTKQDVLPVLTSENPCFGFILRLLKTCAQFKIAFLMWNLTLTLTHHLHPKLWINDPDGITLRKPTLTAFKILLISFRRPGNIIASPTILITSKPLTFCWVKVLFALRFRLIIFITLTKLKDGFYITRMRTTCHHRAICKKKTINKRMLEWVWRHPFTKWRNDSSLFLHLASIMTSVPNCLCRFVKIQMLTMLYFWNVNHVVHPT